MPYPLDEHGVPVLNRTDIEIKAEEVLEHVVPGILEGAAISPLGDVVKCFKEEFGVIFEFEEDLGSTSRGGKVLGKFVSEPRAIFVDRSLPYNDPRWRFTLAHEIGHLVLHRKLKLSLGPEYYSIFADTVEQIKQLSSNPWRPDQWIEWQANAFASSLLMPRKPFLSAFEETTKAHPNKRNKPYIYLDSQPQNISYFMEIREAMASRFSATKTSTKIRMQELAMLIDTNPGTIKHAIEFLREE